MAFNFGVERKNIILVSLRTFEFSHRLGQSTKSLRSSPLRRGQEPSGRWPVERIVVALGSPTLRIEVLTTLTQNGAPHE